MNNSSSGSITALVPGGVVTTQNISTVIKPKENNNSMQFVKIQTPELSKKAVEQIRVAEESKISKDKIKEVEEEWQSNLLNWKSKRRQQFVGIHPEKSDNNVEQNNNKTENSRKIKTFAEMIEQRAKAGNRLNFHLQRYIGDDEHNNNDEHDDELENNFTPDNNGHNNSINQDSDEDSANGRDAVERNHSISQNIASDNHVDEGKKDDLGEAYDDFDHAILSRINHSNNGLRDIVNEDDERELDHKPINSTFKQDIESPPTPPNIHSDVDIKSPMLDIGAKLDNGLHLDDVIKNDDNGSDYDEEEEEQGEEQKHLQRIAFVAKLNAFERMTKPNIQEPKFVPTRTVKAPPPLPLPSKTQSFTNPKNQTNNHKSDILNQPPPRAISVTNTTSILIQQRQPQQMIQPRSSPPMSPQTRSPPQPIPKQIPQPAPKQILQPIPKQIPKDTQQPIPKQSPRQASPPNQSPQVSHVATIQQPPTPVRMHHSQPLPQESPPQPIQHNSMKPIPPQQHLPESPQRVPIANEYQTMSQLRQKIPHAEQPLPQPPPRQEPRLHLHQQQTSPPHPRPQVQQQSQLPLATHSQSKLSSQTQSKTQSQAQPQSFREKNQDRTVLSVSGKKRCSSCKEELGRGAAAFVIESLNLVYHTNCFRCSVCHVNLSNGFRGVDVRVHTGALHCQNCYSKDGLNYSRV